MWQESVPDEERWMVKDRPFRIGDVEYLSTMKNTPAGDRLCIKKPPALVEATVELLAGYQNANIVEVGISRGGSTALVAQIARPRRLVAVELDSNPVMMLEQFIERAGVRDSVRPHYGVDQSDRGKLATILDQEFGDEPLDLVIDDASHLLDLTRVTFEALFPRIRTGGRFILEDWNWQHLQANGLREELAKPESPLHDEFGMRLRSALADPSSAERAAFERWMRDLEQDPDTPVPNVSSIRPLTILVIELLLARACSGDVVSELHVKDHWVTIVRGPASLDPGIFRVADIARDFFGLLPPTAKG